MAAPEGDQTKFPLMDRAELMAMGPVLSYVRDLMEPAKR